MMIEQLDMFADIVPITTTYQPPAGVRHIKARGLSDYLARYAQSQP